MGRNTRSRGGREGGLKTEKGAGGVKEATGVKGEEREKGREGEGVEDEEMNGEQPNRKDEIFGPIICNVLCIYTYMNEYRTVNARVHFHCTCTCTV